MPWRSAEVEGVSVPKAYGIRRSSTSTPAAGRHTGLEPEECGRIPYWDNVDYVVDEIKPPRHVRRVPSDVGAMARREPAARRADHHGAERAGIRRIPREALRQEERHLGARRRPVRVRRSRTCGAPWPKASSIGISGREDYDAALMTYHPGGGILRLRGSTTMDGWISTCSRPGRARRDVETVEKIAADYGSEPGQARHRRGAAGPGSPDWVRPGVRQNGFSSDNHVRQRAYWTLFAGAAGVAYGDHSVWQKYAPGLRPINGPLYFWEEAIHRPEPRRCSTSER